jgi:hypothetical protein
LSERAGVLDANHVGKLERGVIGWPRAHHRAALRAVLGVATDRDLGFVRPVRAGGLVAVVERSPITGSGLAIGGSTRPSELLASLTRLPIAVSREHVDAVCAAAAMFTEVDHVHGGADVAAAAGIHLGHTAELLRLPCPAGLRPDLFSAVGWLGQVEGSAAFDAARYGQAAAAFSFALACAEQGGDWHLRAKVLSSMAREAIWRGDADTALTWIELSLVRADRLTATERAMLLTARARALALLGRVADTMRTVRAADEQFRRSVPGLDPSWMAYYDLAQHLGDTGHALFDLAVHGHHPKQAARRLGSAVAGHQPVYVRSRAMSGLKLATLALRTGDPREGAEIGRRALVDLGQLHSARTVQVVGALDVAAVPHTRLPEVAQLRQELVKVLNPG